MKPKKKKGECVTLYCASCTWSTDLPMHATGQSTSVPCVHCGALLFWHACPQCGLCYAGGAEPRCPSCDDSSLDELEFG